MMPHGSGGKWSGGGSRLLRCLPRKTLRATLLAVAVLGSIFVLYQILSVKQLGDELSAEFQLHRSRNRIMGDNQMDSVDDLFHGPVDVHRETKASTPVIRGVKKSDLKFYQPGTNGMFKCRSNGMEIEFSKVNDDYCDCPEDGSDEPGTNACGNGSFFCQIHRHRFPSVVPSSRVNDGICDCCDGSDEWASIRLTNRLSDAAQEKLARFQSPCLYRC